MVAADAESAVSSHRKEDWMEPAAADAVLPDGVTKQH